MEAPLLLHEHRICFSASGFRETTDSTNDYLENWGGSTRVKRSVIAMYANDASNVSEAEEGDAELHKWRAGAASRL